ncbi:type II toxin-antitoxin system RelE/ParE family toxin [Methylophaga nitratireducenticrescens]|uniref:type II toxin-antitoxin system RelE/ParE family toxin n=1 Tax=Methylophaga nitratireducenticrescens TaxID=754476 RepID=UPI000CDC67AB|nr:type II toxin-antitoxin system RelE/ParE family toxin [Methylophaga nitratireducenticrescens]AUZ84675.1 hypothetical protein CDW43_08830 [Methylophaga nitratireducenticrescens]
MIRWLVRAENDLMYIYDYIARDKPIAAIKTANKILFYNVKLAYNPPKGRKGRAIETRQLVVT